MHKIFSECYCINKYHNSYLIKYVYLVPLNRGAYCFRRIMDFLVLTILYTNIIEINKFIFINKQKNKSKFCVNAFH